MSAVHPFITSATVPEAAADVFAEIAELAAQLCGAAYSVITILEDGVHKSIGVSGGLALEVFPRDSRFCCEVLHSGAPLEVSDAQFDMRYHDDPLVLSGPRIRFYSGVPLVNERGEVLGSLSVLDGRAKTLSASEREALWKLADVVVRLLADIEAARAAEQNLSWQATHDVLTDLENRRQFESNLRRLIEAARAKGLQHAVLYIDLDQFKVVNDTCGHLAGDALLRELAQLLSARMRRGDSLARLGGDEFGVLLESCDLLHAQHVAAQILSAIRGYRFAWQGNVFALGASIGVAAVTPESLDLDSVLKAADSACYLAKDKGRNQVQVYAADDEEFSSRRGEMEWVSRITRAIEDSRFFLHCQRVASLADPAGTAYLELLLRMRDEAGGVVAPMAFIPAAERYHLMGAIDRWVVGKALHCLGGLDAGRVLSKRTLPRFGINLSGASLGDPAFAEFTLQQLEESGAPPEAVCFEVTETAAISNLGRAARFIERFRDLGVRFALDDFGTGLTSFAYLKALPVDYIKIDGSFVRNVHDDALSRAVVDAIQRLARAVGATTIAESVESARTLKHVSDLGIDFAQGFAIHAPEPYRDFAERMHYANVHGCAVHAAA